MSQSTRKEATKPSSNDDNCGKCSKPCKRTQKAMDCDICQPWFHITCSDVEEDEYTLYVRKQQAKKGFKWFCSECRVIADEILVSPNETATSIPKLQNEVNNLTSKINEILDHIKALNIKQQKLEESSTSISNATESLLQNQSKQTYADMVSKDSNSGEMFTASANKVVNTQLQLSQDRQDRENNIMMFNIKEGEDQNLQDKALFNELCCQNLHFDLSKPYGQIF